MKYTGVKKADLFLILFFLAAGLLLFSFNVLGREAGKAVKITVHGSLYGTYPLNENREIVIKKDGHTNIVTVKNGKVSMSFSDCKGQDCVKSGKVSHSGIPVICSPNGVVAVIEGEAADTAAY